MNQPVHTMSQLFAQLGLPAEPEAIRAFIEFHSPLPDGVPLHEAPFWTPAQAAFLCEETQDDADWAPVIDRLNTGLRSRHPVSSPTH